MLISHGKISSELTSEEVLTEIEDTAAALSHPHP